MTKYVCDKYQIGRNMSKARMSSKKSQVAASFEIGRSESTIAKVESGNRLPSIDMLYDYINEYHVDANFLLGICPPSSIDAMLQELDDKAREYLAKVFIKMIKEFPTLE